MKPRIRAYTSEHKLWLLDLYWIPEYREGLDSRREALLRIYNESLSETINKAP